MAEAIQQKSKSELLQTVQRLRGSMKNVREQAAQISERVVESTMTLAGGGAVGVMRGWSDEPLMVPGTEIPLDAAVAASALVVGITGMAGKASDMVTALGSGMGAAILALHVEKAVKEARAE